MENGLFAGKDLRSAVFGRRPFVMLSARGIKRSALAIIGLGVWLCIASCELGTSEESSQTGGRAGSGGQSAAGASGGSFAGSTASGGSAGSAGVGGSTGQAGTTGASGATGSAGAGEADGGGQGGAATDAGESTDAATSHTFHVFLLLGQSNMAGYPKAQAADKVENARIKVLGYDNCGATGRQQDVWDVAAPPLHECWNGAIGPGDYFSKSLLNELPADDSIGLVPCAISGERIETFLKVGGSKYGWIIQRAKLAQQASGVIEGILFHQGESNNGDPSWPTKVNTLITDLRTDLALGDVPFLAGELPYDSPLAGHNALVNTLPSVVTKAYVVSASGLALDPADSTRLHFGHDGQVTLGQRYAAKMLEAW